MTRPESAGDGSSAAPWPIHIISLPRATERRAKCSEAMAALGLNFAFSDAIDGAALPPPAIAAAYDAAGNPGAFKRPLSRPEIGCYLSHHALWQAIAQSAAPGAIILEDDFAADAALPEVLRALCRVRPENCLIKLHALQPVRGTTLLALPAGHRLIRPDRVPGCTLGYLLDRTAAGKLAAKALPFRRPVDMDLKHWWAFDIAVLLVQPTVLHARVAATPSAIAPSRAGTKPAGLFGLPLRGVRNLRYQWRYQCQRRRALPAPFRIRPDTTGGGDA